MKIRGDFVTNSSSTSFIIITDGELEKDTFLKAIGIDLESDMCFIFDELYNSINENKEPIEDFIEGYLDVSEDLETYIKNNYSEELADKIMLSKENGKKVWMGKLSSDRNEYETFFCMDSFIIDDEIYINGANCIW